MSSMEDTPCPMGLHDSATLSKSGHLWPPQRTQYVLHKHLSKSRHKMASVEDTPCPLGCSEILWDALLRLICQLNCATL